MSQPGFWDNQEESKKTLARLKVLKAKTEPFRAVEARFKDLSELFQLALAEKEEELLVDSWTELKELEKDAGLLETEVLLCGLNDHLNCYMTIHAGAGGTDSSDWAEMLMRMYLRWTEKRKYKTDIIDILPNEEAGIKRVVFTIRGDRTFGRLRSEIGIHRLVRISPFDYNQRRHTSFASVDVMPEFEDEPDIEVLDKDLRIETYRSSGAGGQHVNVTESAVRIIHIPTGIIAQCQNERSQHRNKAEALKMLKIKLFRIKEMERQKEMAQLYSEKGDIAWGNQIRSYVMHPYTLVKDHRTEEETADVQAVLDGDLNRFIKAYLQKSVKLGGGRVPNA